MPHDPAGKPRKIDPRLEMLLRMEPAERRALWRHERSELRATSTAKLLERRMTCAHQRSQRSEQRRVRKLGVALLDRLAPQDDGVIGVAVLELPYEARLADARLTTEQH